MANEDNGEPPDLFFDQTGRDSGINSFGSDCSDSVYPSSFLLEQVKVGSISEIDILLENDTFEVTFLGEHQLSRRHTPSMIPWVVEEICLRKCHESVVMTVVKRSAYCDYSVLKIKSSLNQPGNSFFESKRRQVELEHCIKNLTRFSKSFNNPNRFSYLFRPTSDKVFTCFVYEAANENVVNNLFYAIHNAMLTAPRVSNEPSSPPASASSNLYEIVYIGKVVVVTKKAPPTFVDEAVKKFEELARMEKECETKVNDLETIHESQDECVASSSTHENIENCFKIQRTMKQPLSVETSTQRPQMMEVGQDVTNKVRLPNKCRQASIEAGYGTLLLIGQDEMSLLSSEHKHTLKEWKFKDITFCSQGIICCNHFGFIARNLSTMNYICYLFKCRSEAMVDEIMLTMRKAFQLAFDKSSRSLVVCELCPMHQLHKLCLLVENMDQMMIFQILSERIEHLSESYNIDHFIKGKGSYDVPTLSETNVHLMTYLLLLCESKQQQHEHINDCKGSTNTSNFVLFPQTMERKQEAERRSLKLPVVEDMNGNETNRLHLDKWAGEVKQRRHSVPHSLPLSSRSHESPTLKKHPFKMAAGAAGDLVFMDKLIPVDSPIRSMFLKVGNGGNLRMKPNLRCSGRSNSLSSSSSSSSSSSPSSSPLTSGLKSQYRKNRGAWQINILSNLQLNRGSFDDELFKEQSDKERSFHPKSTWKKAIGDTILLIKINKKNEEWSTEEIEGVGSKVDYLEVTPSLKEVTSIWKQLLDSELWKSLRLDPELLTKSVKDGVPKEMRGRIWKLLVHQNRMYNNNINNINNNNNYSSNNINKLCSNTDDSSFNCDVVDFEILKRQLTSHQHAILIDLGRTFPGHPYFATPSGPGQAALFNVLKAYSVLDADVGYCQGLSFVVGVLLIHVDEREAFEILKHIMFRLDFRRQYKPDMVPLQIRMYQLTRMLHDSYRDLYEHLENHQIAPTLYAAPWFLTIFASQFPLGFVARVFDLIFAFGTEIILKVALILLGNHRELIKQCCTFESIVDFLKVTLPDMAIIQMERIFNQVFQLDISKTLEAYEVEYHILHEEMSCGCSSKTPQSLEQQDDKLVIRLSRIQLTNDGLRRQKMELLEQLQTARRQIRTLEAENSSLSSSELNLRSQNKILELERTTLFYTIQQLMNQINNNNINKADSGHHGDDDDDDNVVVNGSGDQGGGGDCDCVHGNDVGDKDS